MIGDMNRKILLKTVTVIQSEGGGPIAGVGVEYKQWAKVEDRSGSPFTGEGQQLYRYDKKITFRAYPSRAITSQFIIVYEGAEYQIQELIKDQQGKLFFWVARCTKVDNV